MVVDGDGVVGDFADSAPGWSARAVDCGVVIAGPHAYMERAAVPILHDHPKGATAIEAGCRVETIPAHLPTACQPLRHSSWVEFPRIIGGDH
jgi:hypothetical protein